MRYVVVYEYSESEIFTEKNELMNFLLKECKEIKDKLNIHNYFVEKNNMIEIHFGRYKHMIMIGINKQKNQKEKTLDLYYDIGKLLGCCSEIIKC